MATVGAYEAKTRLSELLERAAAGETITITKHGKPIAQLTAPAPPGRQDVARLLARMDDRRQRLPSDPEGWSVKKLVDYGRRF